MKEHQSFESLPELKFDKNRNRVNLCPCGKDNRDGKFVPYIGYETAGYCHSCGETFLPQRPIDQRTAIGPPFSRKQISKPKSKIDFIPVEKFKSLLLAGKDLYGENHFFHWLGDPKRGEYAFDTKTINRLIDDYFLSNSIKYKGWVLFPYIDISGNVRDIKAIDYNPDTGKRISQKNGDTQNRCYFIGKEILGNTNANTERSFFGEHLLRGNNKPVRIFESEAAAVYAAPFFPESICVATGGKNGYKWTEQTTSNILQGRKVILYPDIDGHEQWEQDAEKVRKYGIEVQVSQLLKNSAIKFAKEKGIEYSELVKLKYDLRDFLQYHKLADFQIK
ncbi:DUF6371 domain-containing protein [Ravibacter arvi]|uniref:DUF6371 domain-containing protein n=1 Tax=Ravibacter arvi TaxID=2051041 RepID=A0ABP8M1H4_9BACT